MSKLMKSIIIVGSACLLAVMGIGTYLFLQNNVEKKDHIRRMTGKAADMTSDVDDLTAEANAMTGEDDGLIPGEQLCEGDVTEPDVVTLLSHVSVGDKISIGCYGSENLGWIVYDEDENYLYLVSEKVIDARPMEYRTDDEELFEKPAIDSCKFTNTDLCKWLNDDFLNSVFPEEVMENLQEWNDEIKVTLPDDVFVTEFSDYLWAEPTQIAAENGAEIFDLKPYLEGIGEVKDPITGEVIPEDELINYPGLIYPAEAEGCASYALSCDISEGNVSVRSFGFTRNNAGIYEKVGVRPMIKVLKKNN